jgi:ankyrin repeat protein
MSQIFMPGDSPSMLPTRRLPAQPNLEQLRKQAKNLLDQYLSGSAEAVAEVQRFEREPRPSSFALHDAQRVLARAYGYASWPKLVAFVEGANIANLAEAVKAANFAQVRSLLHARPELIHMDMSGGNEHRALHYAVLRRDAAMVRLLMEAGADARKGIYPHRDATSALAIASEREYTEIVAVIEEEERLRREELSCPNATISPVQDQINKAISEGDNARAIQLLDTDKTLIQACDRNGGTPLHIAAEKGNQEMLEWLLARRANVHKRDIRGRTPLDRAALAAADDFPAIANLLLNQGAELTIQGAVALGNAARFRECLAADPTALRRIEYNGGLITLAVNHGQLEIVQLLLDLGADVDERIMLEELEEPALSWGMPLWHAALDNNFAITQLLLDRGADPNANVYASGWPLSRAWNHKDDSVKRLLMERGAKRQPHMIAETHDVAEATRLLQNAPPEDLVHELLWPAAEYGCPAIVELALPLVKWPLDDPRWHWVMIQPIRGATGSIEGNFAAMTLLLQHGVNPNISRYGQTPLHFAAAYSGKVSDAARARFAALLLDFGARLDVRDDLLQSTPLAWACRWGRKELAELLIARGAPIDEPDAQPWAAPTAWAAKMNHGAILTLLQNHRSAVR